MSAPSILVVDDQPINVQLLKRKLEREGIRVVAAYSGKEALELIQQNKPDLILLDVMMPGIDGLEVTRRLRSGACGEAVQRLPVIGLTANGAADERRACIMAGMDEVLLKPASQRELVDTVLRHRRAGGG